MRIKRVELNDFKRFTHLTVEDIPETAKLIVLVGPNGSGKTSFMEALNHYYKFAGYGDVGESNYLSKIDVKRKFEFGEWYSLASKTVDIDFYDAAYPKDVGTSNIKGHFYFRSAYRNEPDFVIDTMRKQDDPTKTVHLKSLIQNDQSVSSNYQRLIANSISELYKSENNQKDVATLRSELTGKSVLPLSEYLRIFIFPLWEIHYKMAISILQKARQKTFLTRIFPLVKSRHLILFWIWLYSQNIIQMQYTVLMSQRRICIQSSKERCFGNSMA